MLTTDTTRTALRNIPSAPSMLDRARKQARTNDAAVYFLTPGGAGVAFPTDGATGRIWVFGSAIEAQDWLTSQGWGEQMEPLGFSLVNDKDPADGQDQQGH